jgi:exopolysaccharide production protein ExoY
MLEAIALAMNRIAAAILLIALGPAMLGVAWQVWRHDRGPILFGHYRVGRDGKLFRCLKFRTMRMDAQKMLNELLERDVDARAEWERDCKLTNDPRITPIGDFLRRTSLDLTKYGRVRWHYLSVRPGITGLWQVSGRSDTTYDQRVDLDRRYVEARSPWVDLWLLMKTVKVVLMRNGAR